MGVGTLVRSFPSDRSTIREKFNLTSNELKQKCNNKGQTFFINITSTVESLRNIRERIIVKYIEGTKKFHSNESLESVILMSQLCERNPDVINVLTKLADAVHLCLEEKEHLNDAEKTSILRNMMLSVCFTLDFGIV